MKNVFNFKNCFFVLFIFLIQVSNSMIKDNNFNVYQYVYSLNIDNNTKKNFLNFLQNKSNIENKSLSKKFNKIISLNDKFNNQKILFKMYPYLIKFYNNKNNHYKEKLNDHYKQELNKIKSTIMISELLVYNPELNGVE